MTREELITIGEHKVRNNETLMLSYLSEFEILFGRKPKCAGCTFKSDWSKFVNANKPQIINTFKMETSKTFELNNGSKSKIHTYIHDKSPRRSYGHNMTESFAKAYLTNGTKKEIAEREKHFKTLPETNKVQKPKEVAKAEVAKVEDVVKVEKVVETQTVSKPKKKRTSKKRK